MMFAVDFLDQLKFQHIACPLPPSYYIYAAEIKDQIHTHQIFNSLFLSLFI